jgi:hypothetical protein
MVLRTNRPQWFWCCVLFLLFFFFVPSLSVISLFVSFLSHFLFFPFFIFISFISFRFLLNSFVSFYNKPFFFSFSCACLPSCLPCGSILQVADLDAIIIPVGGGGLISGMAVAAKGRNPRIKIFGSRPRCLCPLFFGQIQ